MTSPGSGLRNILPAMVAASGLGYAVQVMAPLLLSASDYVGFSFFWSALFLCVSALSGVQNEVSRASHDAGDATTAHTFARYASIVIGVTTVVAIIAGAFVTLSVFPDMPIVVLVSFVLGVVAVAGITLMTGALYGTRRWGGVAVAIVADPTIRAVAFAAILGCVLLASMWPVSAAVSLVAVTAPFVVAALIIWFTAGRRAVPSISFDVDVVGLLKNTAHTLIASTALGFMAAGMPIIVTMLGRDAPSELLAGTVLLVVLVRAPLVSPMIALQSYLTVSFRDAPGAAWRRAGVVGGALLVVTALLAAAAAIWATPLVTAVVPRYVLPSPWVISAIVVGAGLVGVQTVTGALVLSRSLHRAYATGWVATALLTVALSFVPLDFGAAVALCLTVPGVIGCAIHILAGRTSRAGEAQHL